MNKDTRRRVALLYPGDRGARKNATPENSRFLKVFRALAELGVHADPAVYHDDFCDEVRRQLMQVDGVLVWVNPIEGDRDRSMLDALLREVAAAGVFVSTHPDIILKLGTKEVLYQTREIGWGCDTHVYRSMDQMRRELSARLASGQVRVLKQYRGQSGCVNLAGRDTGPCSTRKARMHRGNNISRGIFRALRAVFFRQWKDD